MKKIFPRWPALALLLTLPLTAGVSGYRIFFARTALADGTSGIIIRQFLRNDLAFYLLVHPLTLASEIIPAAGLKTETAALGDLLREFAASPYARALAAAALNAKKLQDSGLTHSLPEERGISLTIARGIWNQYYAPVFGVRDQVILAVYSHMIDYTLYLPHYALGNVIQFQLEDFLRGKMLGPEMKRMCLAGNIMPQLWMKNAVGGEISVKPMLKAVDRALKIANK